MTRKELSQIYYLAKELKRCEENLIEIRASIQAKSQKLTGMPFQNTGSVSNPVEDTVLQLMKAEQNIEAYKEAIAIRKARILTWLNELEDIYLKQIIDYRCLRLMSWEQVAIKMGGGNTSDTVKQYFYRNVPKR